MAERPFPSLSVIMPNYNMARYLPQSLGAIFSQSVQPDEVIVVDDASTDDSVGVLERLAREHPSLVLLRQERNLGTNAAANRALRRARGEWIHGAAADDRVLPGFYEKSLALLARHPLAGACSALCSRIDAQGRGGGLLPSPRPSRRPAFLAPGEVAQALGRLRNWVMGASALFRREALLEAGAFSPELGPIADGFAFWVLALRHGCCFIPEALVEWRITPASYSEWFFQDARATLGMIQECRRQMARHDALFPRDFADAWIRGLCWELLPRTQGAERDKVLELWPCSNGLDRRFVRGRGEAFRRAYYHLRIRHEPLGRLLWRKLRSLF